VRAHHAQRPSSASGISCGHQPDRLQLIGIPSGGRASLLVGEGTTRRHYCGQAMYPRLIMSDCAGTLVENEVEAAAE